MTLDEIRDQLIERSQQRWGINDVSEATGLTRQALYKIMNGETKNPTYATVQRLREYLGGE